MTGDGADLKRLLAHVAQGRRLSESEAEGAFDIIMSGDATPSQMGALLTALGVNIDADLAIVRQCLWEIGLGFLMAPRHHSATRHVAPTRVELGTRTIFNLLGPLSSPAMARRQLVGVFAPEWVRPMAEV